MTWLLSYGGTKEPGGLDRTVPFPAPVLAAPCCAGGRIQVVTAWQNAPYEMGRRASPIQFFTRNGSRAHSWRSVVAWPFLVQSPRAICAALTMHRSLGG